MVSLKNPTKKLGDHMEEEIFWKNEAEMSFITMYAIDAMNEICHYEDIDRENT